MRVLQLVNTPRSFFDKQVEALERRGIECTTVTVPGTHDADRSRSATDYLRYYPDVLDHSLDGYDVVHAHYGLMGPFAIAQPERPVVLTLWGSDLMDEESFVPRLSRLSARLSDEVILPSTTMSAYLDTPHQILPWGVDTEQFRPIDQERARERLGWPQDETTVLFPYPPERDVKNHPLAERVVSRLDGVTLRTMSGVPYEEVPYYMNASDAMLVTSKRESGPMVVKEAAACNVPVISTDVGFVADVLDEVEHSYVRDGEAELADALSDVLAAGEPSSGRSSIVGLDRMGEDLESVYRAAIDGR
ncbi:glycosyltransferase family 4 protein [Haloarcula nitratireducens]|uniref:Glycosyltransferase family 4 protein n=1 Tax=Haloarcula nitratireducens TaxID=2487749 RepID=A0AAW4PD48_9EURY|nr:glycosyltransferase family 4 protein [Halomicroarcula nitratireducens]MBX0295759.1 glycosyltransferase family 4 protein [Halomicroarcula nitratireducens]